MFFFHLFPDGIWTPKLSGRPFQHHNVQFYCISNLFKNTMILTPNTPKNYQGQEFSLSLSPSHLKEHNCLSLIQLQKNLKEKKKLEEFSGFKMERRGKLCIPPMTMVWYCSKWKYKHPIAAAAATTTTKQTCPASSLYTGLSEGYYMTVI